MLDEYADIRPSVWGSVVRPMLADRMGWGIMMGTPRGHDGFYEAHKTALSDPDWYSLVLRASASGIISAEELDAARKDMSANQYDQEFECSFDSALPGAIYADELREAVASSRISNVPYDPALPVHTAWDLGMRDSTSIWFVQTAGREARLIDYYESRGESIAHYAKILQDRGYIYGRHIAPHDIAVRELGTGKSRIEVARSLGIKFEVAPNLPVEDGINAVRLLFPRLWIDQARCADGIEALKAYRRGIDRRTQSVSETILHDWASHAADALRMAAVALFGGQPKRADVAIPARISGSNGWMR